MRKLSHRAILRGGLLLSCMLGLASYGGTKAYRSSNFGTGCNSPKMIGLVEANQDSTSHVVDQSRREDAQFRAFVEAHPNLTAADVLGAVPKRSYRKTLDFNPASAAYYGEVTKALQLTVEEKRILAKRGFVSVDIGQRVSIPSAYEVIYANDLPVLITTDSIMHAVHRSFDEMLKTLESEMFASTLSAVLERTHEQLVKESAGLSDSDLLESVRDVDLYLSVARVLLKYDTLSLPNDHNAGGDTAEPQDTSLNSWRFEEVSRFGQDALVKTLVGLALNASDVSEVSLYGGNRNIDWTQFQPRGHYTEWEVLQRYFRAMMWLGRADTGWFLLPLKSLDIDAERERRNAAVMTYVMDKSGQLSRLGKISKVLDFLVGRSDNLSLEAMRDVFPRIGLQRLEDLDTSGVAKNLEQSVRDLRLGKQSIRSQALGSDTTDPKPVESPALFQVFGQRFVVDSFVLSNVVYDSIQFDGEKMPRKMPQGLDVFAALGNDEALRLLDKELQTWKYGTNLMGTRAVVEAYDAAKWNENVYNVWLDALRTIDDEFPANVAAPQLMRTEAWQHKQLQTQLASWAELRHDTVLYAKQAYGVANGCDYPAGYVEPYPRFFERVGFLARESSRLLDTLDFPNAQSEMGQPPNGLRERFVGFWTNFATTMDQLRTLAQKELESKRFTDDEIVFLKKTLRGEEIGCGTLGYKGWYPKLIWGDPTIWKPTIADVYSGFDADGAPQVLEVGVGDATFIVAAIDNGGDKRVYVGPMYSYFEFAKPGASRLTDEAWGQKIRTRDMPLRPEWTSAFHPQLQPSAKSREVMMHRFDGPYSGTDEPARYKKPPKQPKP